MYENGSLTITVPLYANISIYCRTHNSSRCFTFHHLSVLMLIERLLIQRVFICRNCYMDVARWHWISTKLYADRASNFKIPHVHKGTQRCARRLVNFSQTRKLLSVDIRADKFIGHKIVSRRIQKDYSGNKNLSYPKLFVILTSIHANIERINDLSWLSFYTELLVLQLKANYPTIKYIAFGFQSFYSSRFMYLCLLRVITFNNERYTLTSNNNQISS